MIVVFSVKSSSNSNWSLIYFYFSEKYEIVVLRPKKNKPDLMHLKEV